MVGKEDMRSVFMSSKHHPNWRGGKPLCKTCGKKLSTYKPKLYKCSKCWKTTWSGKKSIAWKGGKKNNNGYVMIWKSDHLHCDSQGYVREHRLVMEKSLGRYLNKDEVVHHINGNRGDNRLENLQLLSKKEHDLIHLKDSTRHKMPKGHVPWNKGLVGVMPTPWNKGLLKRIILICRNCKLEFSVAPCRKEAIFCGKKCYLEGRYL